MDILTSILALVGFIALTASTGLFVANEFSLTSLEKSVIDESVRELDDSLSKQVQSAHKNLSFVLSGNQLGITLTTLATGYLAEPILARYIGPLLELTNLSEASVTTLAMIISLIIATALSMIYGELVPKNLAIAKPMHTARFTVPPVQAFNTVFKFVISGLNSLANRIIRWMGMSPAEEVASARSIQELDAIVRTSAEHGSFSTNEASLLIKSLKFGEASAEELMKPRSTVEWLHETDTAEDLLRRASSTGFSRFPVAQHDLDDTIGVVHIKEVLTIPAQYRSATQLSTLAKRVPLVPSTLDGDSVLEEVRQAGSQMVFVADEYGGIAGIITMEDLVEEILGEVWDEHDDIISSQEIQQRGQDWELSGLVRIDELDDILGYKLTEGPYETLGGLLMTQLGHIPTTRESVILAGPAFIDPDVDPPRWRATVRAMDNHRVDKVHLEQISGGDSHE